VSREKGGALRNQSTGGRRLGVAAVICGTLFGAPLLLLHSATATASHAASAAEPRAHTPHGGALNTPSGPGGVKLPSNLVAYQAPTTTTTAPLQNTTQQAAARSTQTEGYLDPPGQTSKVFAFTGSGATEVSVVWSGSTYLTMVVSCPDASQSVGGTSAMQATLPNAAGSCRATVSEPSSESATLTFTITIGPPGG